MPGVVRTNVLADPVLGTAFPGDIDATATGTAADPAVTLIAMGAALAVWANSVATLADALNRVRSSLANPLVRVV